MVKRGSYHRAADRGEWKGRRDFGRAGLAKAQNDLIINDVPDAWGYVVHDAVLAAIAYGDALTIKSAGIQNTRDHSALPETLSAALGNRFPAQMQNHLKDLLAQKDDSAYSHRMTTKPTAAHAVEKLKRFAEWAERELL